MSLAAPTDPYEGLHWQMVHAHNLFKTAFNSIRRHLDNPPTHDIPNFMGYCEAFAEAIGHHHDGEEVVMFPFLNKKMDFSGEAEAHKSIHSALDSLETLIKEAKANPSKFDAEEMKRQMDDFKDVLFNHLDEEVEHLKGSNLREAGFAPEDVKEVNDKLEDYAKSNAEIWKVLPFGVGHIPPHVKPHWPGFPWIFRVILIPWVFSWKYYGYWKYNPYPMS